MKKLLLAACCASVVGSIFFATPALAFESSGSSGSLSFEIHAGTLNSITGSSSLGNFAILSGGGEHALGLSSQGIFQVFSSIVNWFFAFFTTRYEQIHYRWRDDNGSETTATFTDPEDTTQTNLVSNTAVRLRFEVSHSGWSRSGDTAPQFRIQYSQTATCSSGTYTDVPVTATTEHWQITNSTNLTDSAATTNVTSGLTDANAFFLAGVVKDTGNQTGSIALTSEEFTEIEYSIAATSNAVASANYCFRLTNAGSATNMVYTVYPTVTISSGVSPTITQSHYRFRSDNGSEATASFVQSEDTPSTSNFYVGDAMRLRFLIKNTGAGPATSYKYRLEYASNACSSWATVPTPEVGGSGGSPWSMAYSVNVLNGAVTTNSSSLTDPSGSFTSGLVQTATSSASATTINSGVFSEYEYSIMSNANATAGTTYCFRLTNSGDTSVFTYTMQPQIVLLSTQRTTAGGPSSVQGEGSGSGSQVSGGTSGGGSTTGGEGSGGGGQQSGGGGSGGGTLE